MILFALSLKYFPENFDSNYLSSLLQQFNPFRKYIWFLLQIIYKLFTQALETKNYILAERMKICFYICFNHIRIKNIVPNEKILFFIKEFFKKERENNDEYEQNEEKKENELDLEEDVQSKIIVCYNFTYYKFVDEQYIVKIVNEKEKSFFEIKGKDNTRIFSPKIRYIIDNNKQLESLFISQKQINSLLIRKYNKYLEHLDLNKIDKETILDCCLNTIIFMRNNSVFKKSEDVIKLIEKILIIMKRLM